MFKVRELVVVFFSVCFLAACSQDLGSSTTLTSQAQVLCHGKVPQVTLTTAGTYRGTPGPDVIAGSPGKDLIYGLGGDDYICGFEGDDTIYGGFGSNDPKFGTTDGNDTLNGGPGNDYLNGEKDNDKVFGAKDNDQVYGGRGTNELYGGPGNDFVVGGPDVDKVFGEDGHDTAIGGTGSDYLDAGPGHDCSFGDNYSRSEVTDLQDGNDVIRDSSGTDLIYGHGGNDNISTAAPNGVDNSGLVREFVGKYRPCGVELYQHPDSTERNFQDFINGGEGNDTLVGGPRISYLQGWWGNDTLIGGPGIDYMRAATGSDKLYAALPGRDTLYSQGVDGQIDFLYMDNSSAHNYSPGYNEDKCFNAGKEFFC